MPWLDIVGWAGSALLIYSVMQARVLRFRVLNLVASATLAGFNAALEIWPMVAMNIALCAINVWHIRLLVSTRHDSDTYEVLEVGPQDEYLRHLLRVHEGDILRFQPDFAWDGTVEGRLAFLVQRGDETVGVVLVRDAGDDVARIVLDYVTTRYRDFSPGEFVWRRSGVLHDRGFRTVITPRNMVAPYYARLGFEARPDGAFQRDL
jgi:hypothetical protein